VIMRLIGRFGFPLFAFLIVEGFQHTHSVKKYALNLAIFSVISELPFNLGFSSKLFFKDYQSVYFTLLFGLLCITGIHYFGETRKEDEKLRPLFFVAAFLAIPLAVYMFITNCFIGVRIFTLDWMTLTLVLLVAGVVSLIIFLIVGKGWDTAKRNAFSSVVLPLTVFCALGDLLKTDYGAGGVLLIAVIYLFRKNKKNAFALGCTVLTLMALAEATAFLMLIPIGAYNGKRGMKLNKYVYYAFYPVHIGLIYLLALLMGFTTFAIR
ncbi:MAG: conjugal transfer protein TraX, partial [Acetatifactor sp.]|nr:conjugal transfer protein TraX [Acetatifactor sp.]